MKIAAIQTCCPKPQFTGYAIKVNNPPIDPEMERIYETVVDQDSIIYYYPCKDEKESEIKRFVKKNSYEKYTTPLNPLCYGHYKKQEVIVKDRLPFTKSELKKYQKNKELKPETTLLISETLSFLKETHPSE